MLSINDVKESQMVVDFTSEDKVILENLNFHLTRYKKIKTNLIPILQMIQGKLNYLPPEAIKMVARYLEIPSSEVYGVATFYNQFKFNPPGKNPIKVCLGTACHVRAGDIILENFERKLGILEGQTTKDREFSIERVACVGCCALAPVAMMGDTVHGHMAPSKVEGLILRVRVEHERAERERQKNESDRQ
jgi:NADH-quinone oxidoreductase subunit E